MTKTNDKKYEALKSIMGAMEPFHFEDRVRILSAAAIMCGPLPVEQAQTLLKQFIPTPSGQALGNVSD